MRRCFIGKWKPLSAGELLPWLLGFVLAAVLISGYVRLYALRLENQAAEQRLQELSQELGELKKRREQQETALETRARALGMYIPGWEEFQVLHVRSDERAPAPDREYLGSNKAYSGKESLDDP